jgi:hypothetical protein
MMLRMLGNFSFFKCTKNEQLFNQWWFNLFHTKIHSYKTHDRVEKKKAHYKSMTQVKTHEKRIWRDAILNSLELGYTLDPSTYRSSKMLDPNPLGSATRYAHTSRVWQDVEPSSLEIGYMSRPSACEFGKN